MSNRKRKEFYKVLCKLAGIDVNSKTLISLHTKCNYWIFSSSWLPAPELCEGSTKNPVARFHDPFLTIVYPCKRHLKIYLQCGWIEL